MKILHATVMQSYSPGIFNQMRAEYQTASDASINIDVKIYCPKNIYPSSEIIEHSTFEINKSPLRKIENWLRLRIEYYSWLKKNDSQYDVIILRNSVHDPFLLNFIKSSKTKVLLMHHTLESSELKSLGYLGYIRYIGDKYLGAVCISKSDGIIGVTNEIINFEKSRIKNKKINSFLYPNGIRIDYSELLLNYKSKEIELMFVASYFFDWHGLDLLLKNIKESNEKFILHIIGEVSKKDKKSGINDERIIFHGSLNRDEIINIAQHCNVGLSSFALYRKGMNQACTLKVREYLSLGLPVYSGHQDVFPDDFPYYKYGPPLIDNIIKFSKETILTSRNEIRKESSRYINKKILLSKLFEEIKEIYKK
jgi:hypothetical protein